MSSDNLITCNHGRSNKYAIADQGYQSPQKCQIIGYRCQSYDDFELGKCADCGADGNGCKPMPFNLNYWDDKSNCDPTLVKTQFFVDTGNVENLPGYCLNHYQIVVSSGRKFCLIIYGMCHLVMTIFSFQGNSKAFNI